jgi:GNAT superfamily N-acetyltransferase
MAAAESSHSAGVIVRQVTDDADMHRIAEMESEVWGGDCGWLAAALIARVRGGAGQIAVLTAEASGRVVSAAWLVAKPGTDFAGLWGGSTIAEWRGRGIYRALVSRRAKLAVAQGIRFARPCRAAREKHRETSNLRGRPQGWGGSPGRRAHLLGYSPTPHKRKRDHHQVG